MSDELTTKEEAAIAEAVPGPIVPAPRQLTELDHHWRKAEALARSEMVPNDFKPKQDQNPAYCRSLQQATANCYLALELADRMGASVLEVMQNLYLVHGTPGWRASYMIGQANKHGPWKGGLHFTTTEMEGDTAVECWAIHRETGERVSSTVSMTMARDNGWSTRKGNMYGKLKVQLLSYRAATFFIRLHCPQVMFGMHTTDELEDIGPRAVEAEVSDTVSALQQSLLDAETEPQEETDGR